MSLSLLLSLTGWTFTRSTALAEAERDYARGDLVNALRRSLDHVDRRPWSIEAHRLAALCLIRLDYPLLAADHLDLDRYFRLDDARQLARGLERAHLDDQAAVIYQRIIVREPDDALSLERLAVIRVAQSRFTEARALAERLATLPGTAAAGLSIQGRALLLEGKSSEAIAPLTAALQADPDFKSTPIAASVLWSDLTDALIEAGRGTEARRLLETRLRERGDDAFLVDRLAVVAAREGKTEEAESLWRKASELEPSRSHPWLALGRLALSRGAIDDAIAVLTRAAALDSIDPEIPYNLSLAYQRAGKVAEAERQRRLADELRAKRPGPPRGMDAMP